MQIAVLEHKVYTCKAGCNVTVLLYSLNDAGSLCEACHEGALFLLQGIAWSYEALAKDMLELHDPDCLRAVHGYKLQLDARATAPQHPSLHDVYAECISTYANWFQQLHKKYPQHDFLAATARADIITARAGSAQPDACSTSLAKQVLQASALECTTEPATGWLHAVASHQQCSVPDLMQQLQDTLASSTFMQQQGSCASEAASFLAQEQASPTAPSACWRLLAIMLERNVYVLDIPNSRLSLLPSR